jgi:hypothetical protein
MLDLWLPKPAIIQPAPREPIRKATFPGTFPVGLYGGEDTLTTLTQVLSATAEDSTTIAAPMGIQAGDLILLFDYASASKGDPSLVTPSGFTAVVSDLNSPAANVVSYKIATGSEGGTNITGMVDDGSAAFATKLLYVFRGNVPIVSITATDTATQSTSGDPGDQTANASTETPPLIVFGTYGCLSAAVDPRSFSPAKDGELSAGHGPGDGEAWLAYKIYNSGPANVTIGMSDEGSFNSLSSGILECS